MCSSSQCQSPPAYSSRGSAPFYSVRPSSTEFTLQQSPRRSQSPPTGMCIKSVENVSLVVLGQEDNVERPRVEAGTQLNGSILFQRTENIKSVVLRIDGLLETVPLPASYLSIPLFSTTNRLYNNDGPSPACPHSFSFSHAFPSKFRYKGELHSLPPTCHMTFDNARHFIKCAYRITVTVISARHRRASFLTKSDQVTFELNCRPRTQPSQPIISNPSLFATVKSSPEEWVQCPKVVNIPFPSDSPVICDVSCSASQNYS
ncbi:hypothetical protein B0H19DRAFT_1099327 [Mycena capillaripes]|nr:hypothetical protein B0H19DRAFT_1099327 [Mycena capillaripes]